MGVLCNDPNHRIDGLGLESWNLRLLAEKLQCREEEEAAAAGAVQEQLRDRGGAQAVADRGEQHGLHAVRLRRAGRRDGRFLRREPARQRRLRAGLQGEYSGRVPRRASSSIT